MRILLVGNYPLDHQPSMSRYAEMLRREMTQRGHKVELLLPQPRFGRLRQGGAAGKWLGYIDKYLLFPLRLRSRSRGFDVVHVCDHSNSMYLPWVTSEAKSITCHDLLAVFAAEGRYPQQRVSKTGQVQQRWIRRNLMEAPRVVCVSEKTASEFATLGARGDQVCRVILNPLNTEYAPAAEEMVKRVRAELGVGEEGYLLHVGGDSWYKNRLGAVRIYRLLAEELERMGRPVPRLVLAGEGWSEEVRAFVQAHGLESRVMGVLKPEDDRLQTLYTGAVALLFPSLYEGFGWPLLEAHSCGCPVITSNRAPMTEVAGEGALLIDPEDEAGAVATIAASWDRLGGLREAGRRNLQRFAREGLMDRYEEFFAETMRGAAGAGALERKAKGVQESR